MFTTNASIQDKVFWDLPIENNSEIQSLFPLDSCNNNVSTADVTLHRKRNCGVIMKDMCGRPRQEAVVACFKSPLSLHLPGML